MVWMKRVVWFPVVGVSGSWFEGVHGGTFATAVKTKRAGWHGLSSISNVSWVYCEDIDRSLEREGMI